MKVRALITLLLICCLGATHASAGARFAERGAREQLTSEEEREAREVANAIFKRLEEEQDIAPLLEEMFVRDFAARLHASVSEAGSLYLLDRTVATQASRDEVLRHHVSVSNLILLTSLYMTNARLNARAERRAARANEQGREGKAEEEGATEEEEETREDPSKLADIFPPEVLELFRADPLIGRFVIEQETREAREAAPQEAAPGDASAAAQADTGSDEEEFISTVEQLRAFTSTVERANELLRKRLTSEQKKRVFDDWRRAAEKEDSELMRPHATAVTKEWYGYPEGTRLVCVNLLM
ncbi:MAG TPA: hypothetical protein VF064_12345, partial [Pyrinomonadaceae bacterium]